MFQGDTQILTLHSNETERFCRLTSQPITSQTLGGIARSWQGMVPQEPATLMPPDHALKDWCFGMEKSRRRGATLEAAHTTRELQAAHFCFSKIFRASPRMRNLHTSIYLSNFYSLPQYFEKKPLWFCLIFLWQVYPLLLTIPL